jgi:hypothetical protein
MSGHHGIAYIEEVPAMRVLTASLATAAVIALVTPGVAHATNWITVGPYAEQAPCQVDMEQKHQVYPAWGCYFSNGGWWFQYNQV